MVDDGGRPAQGTGRGTGRPTLTTVARIAGLSRGTASRALRGDPNVSAAALAAVRRAAEMVGYRPDLNARSLALGRSGSIGLLVSESNDRVFHDPFFAEAARGAHRELSRHGTQLVLMLSQTPQERARALDFAAGRHLDGVLLISVRGDDPVHETLLAQRIPVVFCGRVSAARTESGLWWVDADNRGGARAAVRHLVQAGRRRIAILGGPSDLSVGRERVAGWRDELRASGLDPAPALLERGKFSYDFGREGARRLLEREPAVDAIFATSDQIAFGALRTLREAGRRVPDDVALVGFDDSPAAAEADPPLTTVRQPVEEMGCRMAAMLLGKLAGTPGEASVVLPTELVVRRST